jgi:tetratricopeptide (TPR) repeat protein
MQRALQLALLMSARVALADPTPDAAQLYHDGQTAYDQARYDDAIAEWQQSYELSLAPALLYNIAQALRLRSRPGDCGAARARYREFVALVEPSPQREIAERYIAELASCASTSAPANEPIPTTERMPTPLRPSSSGSEPRDTTSTRNVVVAAIAVGGIGILVGGIALGHHASVLGDEVTSACSVSCDWSAEKSKDAAGHRDSELGWTLGALGAVVLAGDAALYYLGLREHGVGAAPVGSQPGATITWSRAW